MAEDNDSQKSGGLKSMMASCRSTISRSAAQGGLKALGDKAKDNLTRKAQ